MKKYIYILISFICIFGCSAQKKYQTINENDYNLISTYSLDRINKTHFLKNETELKNFYKSLDESFIKSAPRIVVDFDEKQVVLVYKNHIDSYNLDFISGNDKIYQLHLSLLEGIELENDPSNFLMIVVPKTIEKVTIK
ncbi:hypothetical protein [Chishuiella changwenlii]|uniref:hypothetical protein n=1 Tax=Chishuiella changwenlii TaxID=1434701 RepID=UPI002FD88676